MPKVKYLTLLLPVEEFARKRERRARLGKAFRNIQHGVHVPTQTRTSLSFYRSWSLHCGPCNKKGQAPKKLLQEPRKRGLDVFVSCKLSTRSTFFRESCTVAVTNPFWEVPLVNPKSDRHSADSRAGSYLAWALTLRLIPPIREQSDTLEQHATLNTLETWKSSYKSHKAGMSWPQLV